MAAPPIIERHLPHFHRRVPVLEAVRVATTANITIATALNNGDSLDGVTLATGDRVLVKNQTTGSQNGIYEVAATPVRAYDVSTDDPNFGYLVYVKAGTTNAGTIWKNTNTTVPTIDTTSLAYAQITGSSSGNDTYLDHGNTGATETFDQSAATHHRAVLDANCTFTFTGAVAGQSCSMILELVQDATGSRTVTLPGSVVWVDGSAPVLSTAAGAIDFLTFLSHDGGTTWYGFEGAVSLTFATPAIVLGTAGAAGTGSSVIRHNSTIAAFDATVPTTSSLGDAAATGSAAFAARRDHVHGREAASTGGSGDHEHMIDVFSGDGSTTAFEITDEPVDAEMVFAFVGGSWTAVTVSGAMSTTVTFGSAPASGTNNVVIQYPAVAA